MSWTLRFGAALKKDRQKKRLWLTVGLSLSAAPGLAAPFTPGNVVIYRVGNGTETLAGTGNSVFLDEYSSAGALVQSIALPNVVTGNNKQLIASGTATSEGLLSRSSDGRFIVLAGYSANVGGVSGTVPRTLGRVDANGNVDTSTSLLDFSPSNNPRSAASVDGSAFYGAGGAGGIRYALLGATTSTLINSTGINFRQLNIFDNQLYVSTSSGAAFRIGSVGTGTPTTGSQPITPLPGFPTGTGSPYGFFLADLNAGVAGVDTLYVASDDAGALSKYSLVAGNFVSNGTIGVAGDAYRGLTAVVNGSNVTLYATRKSNELVSLVDSSGYNAALSGTPTLLATASANTVFRGVALSPVGATVSQADLLISLDAPASAVTNTPFNYTLTVSNNGNADASGITAQFTLPAGVTFNSVGNASGFTGTQSGNVVTFSGGSIATGAQAILTVNVTPTSAGNINSAPGSAVVDPADTVVESNNNNNASTQTVTTTVGNTPNTAPTIIGATTTTPYLNVPAIAPAFVSGVIADPTDPARILGIDFTISDSETAATALTVTATSSNTAVVTNANLVVTGSGATRNLKITPTGVGLANITVSVDDGTTASTYTIQYAASAASATPATTRFHTQASDASAAIAIDANFMIVADDDDQRLRLYNRTQSGLPLNAFDFTANLGLTDISGGTPREVDIEASTRVNNRIFWLGSQSNASSGNLRPNRSRIFGTDLTPSGATSTLSYVGRYDFLRADLIAWDSNNTHGKGANFYGLAASAASGKVPESPDGSGFNIEGLTMAPGSSTTAYIGFRAPIVPATARTRALVVPITNFSTLAVSNGASGSSVFGAPIELDLGGRGIRSMESNGTQIVIIVGPTASAGDFRLYTWTGNAADAPVLRSANLGGLNPEAIIEVPAGALAANSPIALLSDNGDTVFYNDGVIAKEVVNENFAKFRSDAVALGATPTRIREIQGAAQLSPLVGQSVSGVTGVVTVKRSNGFYFQDPNADNNDATSEAIFVFTNSAPTVNVGDAITVNGTVSEFRAGGASGTANLTLTQITSPVIAVNSTLNALPATTIIGQGGRVPPTEIIEDDASGDVETSNTFDPASDGIDFYESLEGMLVRVNNAVATGATVRFGTGAGQNSEISVLADNGANASVRTPRGGVLIRANDFNPERIIIGDINLARPANQLPDVNTGDGLGNVSGVMDYSFGNFKLLLTSAATRINNNLQRTIVQTTDARQLSVGTFNVENLDANEAQSKFDGLAALIVNNLKAPDILTLEEIQDNNGATNDAVVDATQTLNKLIAAIATAGGPTYSFRQVDPVDDTNGGEPGGNIRVGFLFNTARGVSFVDRGDAAINRSTTGTQVQNVNGQAQLSLSPGLIDPTNDAFDSSRKPLVGEFRFRGQTYFVIGNHLNSKGGDQPLFGRFQPPVRSSEVQRKQQATIIRDFVNGIKAANAQAPVVVLGDINDFEFSEVVDVLEGAGLRSLFELLPQQERYSYVFDGNSQVLDQIIVSNNLFNDVNTEFEVAHVNAEFFDQLSDHDPQVARFLVDSAPVASGQTVSSSGQAVAVTLVASDANGDALTYTIVTPPTNGKLSGTAPNLTYTPNSGFSGSDSFTFKANDGASDSNVATVTITVPNNAPVLSNIESGALNIVENAAATPVTQTLQISDANNSALTSATVSISTGFISGQDILAFTANPNTTGNIASNFNASTGVLTLTSAGNSATLAQFQAALRLVTYRNSSENPNTSARRISFVVRDSVDSNILGRDLSVSRVDDAPLLSNLETQTLTFSENDGATPITRTLQIVDVDNSTLSSARVAIVSGFIPAQDVLNFTPDVATTGNIAGSFNASTGVLSLSSAGNTATVAQFQAALLLVTYRNGSENPNTQARRIEFQVSNALSSNIAARDLEVRSVNDVPLALAQNLSVDEDQSLRINLSGSDTENSALTFRVSRNPLYESSGNNAQNPLFEASQLQQTGSTLTFAPPANFNGSATFEIVANDGNSDSLPVTITVQVLATNDAPIAQNDTYPGNFRVLRILPSEGVLSNDRDIEGTTLRATLVTRPSKGNVVLNPDGSFTYAPNPSQGGADSFSYQANDGQLRSEVATVQVNAAPALDRQAPSIVISTPRNGSIARRIAAITGFASDGPGDFRTGAVTPSGVRRVEVLIVRLRDGFTFNGRTFVATSTPLNATYDARTRTWRLGTALPSESDLRSGVYQIVATAIDGAGNRGRTQSFVRIIGAIASNAEEID